MSSLSSRLDALETDNSLFLVRACPACRQPALAPETSYLGDASPPCTRGLPHAPLPAPTSRDITLVRSYGLPDLQE